MMVIGRMERPVLSIAEPSVTKIPEPTAPPTPRPTIFYSPIFLMFSLFIVSSVLFALIERGIQIRPRSTSLMAVLYWEFFSGSKQGGFREKKPSGKKSFVTRENRMTFADF
jgi:hypothetical protein